MWFHLTLMVGTLIGSLSYLFGDVREEIRRRSALSGIKV